MQKKDAQEIINHYNAGTATEAEKAWVEGWYAQLKDDDISISEERITAIQEEVYLTLPIHTEKAAIKLWSRIAAAASILLMLSLGGYLLLHKTPAQQIVQNLKHDAAPAIAHATLTLANGNKIILTKSLLGKLAQQGNTSVSITKNEALTYSNKDQGSNQNIQYNTLSTIRGEHAPFVLLLADGTRVWLNAASSITYPVAFNNNERLVTVTGEAYFEVVHMASKPFRVNYKNQTIEDIGTHFNINAYDDEPFIKTTLIEGSISITKDNKKAILKPGQQAISATNTNAIKVKEVDTEEAIAWKNGYFLFDNEDIESVMRKISRWYNVSIDYPAGQKVKASYWGSMSRETNLSLVLRKLETISHVRFKVEGDRVIVSKK